MSLTFEKVETGRTHSVTGKGELPITNEDGSPEAQYVLAATVDGVKIPLLSKSAGYVDALVARGKESQTADGEPEHGANLPPEARGGA